jgi:serine/threonine-protein kinase
VSVLEELREALKDQYQVESELGRGGMATVFLAEDLKHGRRVAIKVLSPELSSSLDGDRFKSEIQIAARLSHPHILPLFDSGEANGLLYYTMPLVEGESLRGRLERETQLSIDDAIAITCEVADALSYAHAFGVVHRDIKPENILLHGGHAVVADFGIARVIQDAGGTKLTQTGLSVGTASYMSPEQFSGGSLDGRSDMYSLACVLYEMLVGEVPFTGPSAVAIMARHTMEAPPSIQIVRSTVPDELENTIMRALEKVPADRFPTVAQFKEALLGQGATSTYVRRTRAQTRQHTAMHPTQPIARRRRTLVFGAVAIVLLALSGLAARYYYINIVQQRRESQAAGSVDLHRIAVLYFDDGSRDSSLVHIADGFTESLIAQLSQVEGLDIISAGGVAPYRRREVARDSIAHALGAGTLVYGGVETEGNELRVTVRLAEGQSGAEFDRRTFRLPRSQVLNARDSLARATAFLLRQRLGEEIRLREQRSGTNDGDAWALVQRAENANKDADRLVAAGDPQSALQRLAVADSLAARAAERDTRWVEPLVKRSALALAQAKVEREPSQVAARIAAGLAQADAAIAVDPRSADAYELRGTLKYLRLDRGLVPDQRETDKVLADAERDVRQALAIAQRQATAWYMLSVIQYAEKNIVEAGLSARRALEYDAFQRAAPDILYRVWTSSYSLEVFVDAIQKCDEGRRRFPSDPRFLLCQLYLMMTKAVEPDPAEAWRLEAELERLTPKHQLELRRRHAQLLVAIALGRAGLKDSARHVVARAHAESDVDPRGELMGYEALAYTFLGDKEKAISVLERAVTLHPDHRAGFAKVNAWWWRDLQQDPRFKTLAGTGG